MIDISVIIVSFNHCLMLCECLDSINKYNDIGNRLEVIVSDNSPDEELYNHIKHNYQWVKIIKNDNIGFGAGNNRGYENSSGRFILFLNPDTLLIEPIFEFAIEKFENDSDLGLFGVQLVDKFLLNNHSFDIIDPFLTLGGAFKARKLVKRGFFADNNMLVVGADLFVRRTTFEEAGRFDENIFMYREEEDLIKRIKLKSASPKVAFFGEKKIIHLEGGTEGTDSKALYNKLLREHASEKYYTKKWGIDFIKISKNRIRYFKILMLFQYITLQIKKAKAKKEIIKIYKSILNENNIE